MKVISDRSPHDIEAALRPTRSAVTMGNFDGVHRGHQVLLSRAIDRARLESWEAWVLTFDPHPARIVAPERAPAALMSLDDRLQHLQAAGIDGTWVIPFDEALAQMEPEDFVRVVLVDVARAGHLVLGPDARFGKNRRGDADMLIHLGAQHGFSLEQVAPLPHRGLPISSSRIRKTVAEGHVDEAADMLGRPFRIDGVVIRGDQRGRVLGFPTANLQPAEGQVLPAFGVYWATLRVRGESLKAPAAVNIGVRPTFDGNTLLIEAHALGFSGDLYGKHVELDLHERLRGEMKFDALEELEAQLRLDVAAVAERGTQ